MEEDLQQLRPRSSAVFGNRLLAEVVLAITSLQSGDGVTVRMIATHLGVADNLVRPVVLRLAEAGFLIQRPPARPRGPTFYEYAEANDEWWSALQQLCALLAVNSAENVNVTD